jgi:branched-chain amino acid transport system permease protein
MNMDTLIQQVINGLTLGSVYALIALGYTMVYGIIKLLNFAHGDIFMVGAFISYYLILSLDMNIFVAFILTMILTAVLGVITDQVAYKPLRKAPRISALITAIGVSYLLRNGMIVLVGAETRSYLQAFDEVPAFLNQTFQIGNISIKSMQIILLVTTILLMVLLQFVVQKTKMGKAMRAVSVDAEAAQLMGINTNTVIAFTFVLGSALAGASGMLVGVYYNSISPMLGAGYGNKAFVAAVIGGIGLIPGAVLGGYLLGMIEVMITAYGNSMIRDAVVYIILIIILLIRPAGLLGKNQTEKV